MKTSLLKSVVVALVLSLATNAWGGNASLLVDNGASTEQSADRPDVMPQYPGGLEALMNYITSEMEYPDDAFLNGLEGTCVVQFVVTKTGQVDQVKVLRSVSPELDAEVVRVCSQIGNFEPGQVEGKPVNVSLTLPVKFKLESSVPYISEELLDRANKGDMEAQYIVGYSFFHGDGVPLDWLVARHYLEKAAQQGHEQASELLEKTKQYLRNELN
ncbi:MAG: TonB family protein [Muribaculaceae bacterium]|nr:TonB family protein [Muribaculaceae bacterium]